MLGYHMLIRTDVQPYFQLKTLTVSRVVIDIATNNAAVVDPILDDIFKSGDTYTKAADALLAYVRYENLTVQCIFKTHAHANHVSGARYPPERAGGETVIGKVFNKTKTLARGIETANAHPAINSGDRPRGAVNSDRRKRCRQLVHPAQRLANSKVA